MNRKNAALAFALAVSSSGLALAAGIDTDLEVRAMLAAQGYSGITNVQRKENGWSADAKAVENGNMVRLRIDSDSGLVLPDVQSSEKSSMDVLLSIQAAGYTNIGNVRFFGGVWRANATSSTGHAVKIKVNPSSGEVIDEKVE